jgi:hypothetical protein
MGLYELKETVCEYFVTKIRFHGEELLAPRPSPKLEDHPLSTVRDCLFNIFAATLHIGGSSSIRKLRTPNDVVTGTHFSHNEELNDMYSSHTIVWLIKSRRMRWEGHAGVWGRGEACTGFWCGNLREREHWGDAGVDGRIIFRLIFRK